jgi:hypothetical protein
MMMVAGEIELHLTGKKRKSVEVHDGDAGSGWQCPDGGKACMRDVMITGSFVFHSGFYPRIESGSTESVRNSGGLRVLLS